MAWGPMPVEAVDRIRELGPLAIRGNADRDPGDEWVEEQLGLERLQWLQTLPEQIELEVEGSGGSSSVMGRREATRRCC